MTTGGTSPAERRAWTRAAALAVALLAVLWGLVIVGAGNAFAMGAGTGGDGSSGISISLIPPTSSAIQSPDPGSAGSSGAVTPSTGESIWVSLIPPTSSAIDDTATTAARAAGAATQHPAGTSPAVEVEAESREASAQPTTSTVAPTVSASSAPAAGTGGDGGSSLPETVSASGFGALGSWLIGVAAAVLIGAAIVLLIARRRLRHR